MTNMDDLYRLLRTSHLQAQGVIDTVPDPLLVLDDHLRVQSASRSFFEKFKVDSDETIGLPIYELGSGQWDIPELRRLLVEVIPKANAIVDYRVEHEFPNIGQRTMLVTARKLNYPNGDSRSMLLSFIDATEQRQRDFEKEIQFREVRHRIRNLLAIVQALARQIPADDRSASAYRHDFLDRFGALVQADELAFGERQGASLSLICARNLAPFKVAADTITIEGDGDIEFDARTVMSLSLVLHELATNALKHGALSVPSGQVTISWKFESSGKDLQFDWVERGGPLVLPPAETGYGSYLIKSTIAFSLGGEVAMDFRPEGLRAQIVMPV